MVAVAGMAYLETTNLDGETNLKIRNSFYQASTMNSEDGDVSFHGLSGLIIECEQPNNRVNEFEGFVSFQVPIVYKILQQLCM